MATGLALHNPEDMGSGNYGFRNLHHEMMRENVKKRKAESPIPNIDLNDKSIVSPRPLNLGYMKDNPPAWRFNKYSGVDYFTYATPESRERNTMEFDKINTPDYTPRTKKEREQFMQDYDPDKQGDGIWFGGRRSRRRLGKKRRKTKIKLTKRRRNKRKTKKRIIKSHKRR